jgi:hypothetical protein
VLYRKIFYHSTAARCYVRAVPSFRITVADVNADADRTTGNPVAAARVAALDARKTAGVMFWVGREHRTAEAMCAYLASERIKAEPADGGATIVVRVRNATAASHVHSALVSHLLEAAYRWDSMLWACRARGDRCEPSVF